MTYIAKYVYTNGEWVLKMDKPTTTQLLKTELANAGYRVAATQGLNLAHGAVIALLTKAGYSEGMINVFLTSEYGKAFLALAIGMGVEQMPDKGVHLTKIAKEFRVKGLTAAGNEIIGTLVETVFSVTKDLPVEAKEELQEKAVPTLHFPVVEDQSRTILKTG